MFILHLFCRLKREDGGGQITILTMAQPQQQSSLQQQTIQQQPVQMDHDEKKMRRQIANSNERRRMQSINAGFQSLRQLLPHHEGEKLSKVSHSIIIFFFDQPVRKIQTIWFCHTFLRIPIRVNIIQYFYLQKIFFKRKVIL